MKKFLITAIVILSLILAALLGFIVYETTHVFVDGIAYPKSAQTLDLREESVSENHYLQLQSLLPECNILWNVPFQGGYQSSDVQQLTLTSLQEADIRILKTYFRDLARINAENCRDYALLAELARAMPGCDVAYRIWLGDTSADPAAQSLTLEPGSFVFETLLDNLQHLPGLQSIHFPRAELSLEQQEQLKTAYPQIALSSTVLVLGKEYKDDVTELDLSAMGPGDVEEAASRLALLPRLTTVQLGTHLELGDVKKLKDAAPDVFFRYSFDFYGLSLTTEAEEVILKDIKVEDPDFPQQIRNMLDIMDSCKRMVLEARGPYDKIWKYVSDEDMAQIREEYRDKTKVVWRVYFGDNGSSLTDAQAMRAVYGLTDDNSHDLIYCEDVRFLDVGHNEYLDYMDFISGMTSLEAVIVSGAPLKSLEPFAACKNLKFLEMSNCHYVPSLEPLRNCTELEMLNISYTKVEDLSPVMELNLTHLTTVMNPLVSRGEPGEQLQAFITAHPDCWTVYKGTQEFGEGWRTDAEGKLFGWYAKLEDVFHYSRYAAGGTLANNTGWYLDAE